MSEHDILMLLIGALGGAFLVLSYQRNVALFASFQSLEQHYVHKDKLRELRDEMSKADALEEPGVLVFADKLNALLGEPQRREG